MKNINVAIGFVTGRKHFQNVLRSYINNWHEQGLLHDENICFHLFVAYDLKYQKTEVSDYHNIPPELAKMVESIRFYGNEIIEKEKQILKVNSQLNDAELELVFGEGYARKRNAVSYFAMKSKMDRLIFIDDDEYPFAVMKNGYNRLVWMGQSVVGTHLKYISDADITHGHHCGYISPIPYFSFDHQLNENDFRQFIEAISNDIISWEKIRRLMIDNYGVTYAEESIINQEIRSEVREELGMKFISGANLCFNLTKGNYIPPFYNPPGARGEDAFMSTELGSLKVVKVPCYTFHDGFMTHGHMLNGILPTHLDPVTADTPVIVKRFINATIGWIRYKPLLIYITQNEQYEMIIKEMELKLHSTIPKMNAYFKTEAFNQVLKEFKYYTRRVKGHFDEFQATKQAWIKLTKSIK